MNYEIKRQTAVLNGMRIYRVVCNHPSCRRVIGPPYLYGETANGRMVAHAENAHGTDPDVVRAAIEAQQVPAVRPVR